MIKNLSYFFSFFLISFLSSIDSFNALSYSKVITLIQSPNFVKRQFNFDMYSLVIKIAILVKKAVEEVNTMPMPRLINDIVEVLTADPDPIKLSVIINNTFFSFKFFYLFL